ncbi:MAG: calcium/sodium antiporter [Deltaproteobacteria bacterium]|nr:calcium/sodium antiporter [Deltaproteobacteria bacterium]
MPAYLLWSLVLLASLAALIKGADIFVEHCARLARALGVPHYIIGVTLVALGTSLPELAASLASVFSGAGEFVAGTVVGSNVANILFILGAAIVAFRGFLFSRNIVQEDMPVLLLAAMVISLFLWDGRVSRFEGSLLVVMYGVYLLHTLRRQAESELAAEGGFRPVTILWLGLSGALVWLGADFTVKACVQLTALMGLGDTSLLAITVVAVGSSLPELLVSLAAARKKYYELSLGNVVGSNICNSFAVLGLPALVKPLPSSELVNGVGLPYMLAASLLLLIYGQRESAGTMSGLFFLILFVAYLGQVLGLS